MYHYKVNMLEALALFDLGEFNLAFFMNATPISDDRNLTEKGIGLPERPLSFF